MQWEGSAWDANKRFCNWIETKTAAGKNKAMCSISCRRNGSLKISKSRTGSNKATYFCQNIPNDSWNSDPIRSDKAIQTSKYSILYIKNRCFVTWGNTLVSKSSISHTRNRINGHINIHAFFIQHQGRFFLFKTWSHECMNISNMMCWSLSPCTDTNYITKEKQIAGRSWRICVAITGKNTPSQPLVRQSDKGTAAEMHYLWSHRDSATREHQEG